MATPPVLHRHLSLSQTLKLVFASAVACAMITPFTRCIQLGIGTTQDFLIGIALVVTLVLILLSLLMMASGPRRSALILTLSLGCLSVMFGEALRFAWPLTSRMVAYGWGAIRPMEYSSVAIVGLSLPTLAGLILLLGQRLKRIIGADPTHRA